MTAVGTNYLRVITKLLTILKTLKVIFCLYFSFDFRNLNIHFISNFILLYRGKIEIAKRLGNSFRKDENWPWKERLSLRNGRKPLYFEQRHLARILTITIFFNSTNWQASKSPHPLINTWKDHGYAPYRQLMWL